jgi:hypothetical protein
MSVRCSHFMRLMLASSTPAQRVPFTVGNWMEVSRGWKSTKDPREPHDVSRAEALELVNKWNRMSGGKIVYWVEP